MIYYYCSPDGTGDGLSIENPGSIATVKSAVAALAMTESVTVWVRGGTYWMDETLQFGPADSGKSGNKVIWRAYTGEMPVWSGGIQITNWTLHDAAKNIWSASVPAGVHFRNVWVNGSAAIRSRLTHVLNTITADYPAGLYRWSGSLSGNGAIIPTISKPEELEIFWPGRAWTEVFIKGGHVTSDATTFTLWGYGEQPNGTTSIDVLMTNPQGVQPINGSFYKLENAYEFLTAETSGMWHLDRDTDTLYYQPRIGEDLSTSEVIIPKLQTVLNINGLSHCYFVGIKQSHADWSDVNDFPDLINIENMWIGITGGYNSTLDTFEFREGIGATEIRYSKAVKFIQPIMNNVGGQGFRLEQGALHCSIDGGLLTEIGGVAVWNRMENWFYLYVPTEGFPTKPWRIWIQNEADRNAYNTILNNKIIGTGRRFLGSAPIFIGGAEKITVKHNDISDAPWSGMAIKTQAGRIPYPFDHVVSNNRIHHVFTSRADGGGIFNHACAFGTKLFENYIYDIGGGGGARGIMLDLGPLGYDISKNVIDTGNQWLLALVEPVSEMDNSPWYAEILDLHTLYPNRIYDNFVSTRTNGSTVWYPECHIFENNQVFTYGSPPLEAQDIIDRSGLQLLSGTEVIDGQIIAYGWGENVTVGTTDGTVSDYEEVEGMWRATVSGVIEGTIVSAQTTLKTQYLTITLPQSTIIGLMQAPIILKGQGNITFPFNISL